MTRLNTNTYSTLSLCNPVAQADSIAQDRQEHLLPAGSWQHVSCDQVTQMRVIHVIKQQKCIPCMYGTVLPVHAHSTVTSTMF